MVYKVLEGSFVIKFGGEVMVAKPESYQATTQLSSKDDDESSSTPVLGIALGVVFGALAVVLIVGILFVVRHLYLSRRDHEYFTGVTLRVVLTSDAQLENGKNCANMYRYDINTCETH